VKKRRGKRRKQLLDELKKMRRQGNTGSHSMEWLWTCRKTDYEMMIQPSGFKVTEK
jgi:hypothetical protein